MKLARVEDRFWSKVDVGLCWEWTGGRLAQNRYGGFWLDGKNRLAHRVAWSLLVGEIPGGMVLDHLCRNTLCVNPDHLEPVSATVNVRRSSAPLRYQAQRYCVRGHPYNEEHVRTDINGHRFCHTCKIERQRKRRAG